MQVFSANYHWQGTFKFDIDLKLKLLLNSGLGSDTAAKVGGIVVCFVVTKYAAYGAFQFKFLRSEQGCFQDVESFTRKRTNEMPDDTSTAVLETLILTTLNIFSAAIAESEMEFLAQVISRLAFRDDLITINFLSRLECMKSSYFYAVFAPKSWNKASRLPSRYSQF